MVNFSGPFILDQINSIMNYLMGLFSKNEKHESLTKENLSMAFKLTIAKFLNSSLVLFILYDNSSNWFEEGDLVNSATYLIILQNLRAPVFEFIDIWRLIPLGQIKS